MNMVNEGVLPPDELDDRDERREEQERARSRETVADIVAEIRAYGAQPPPRCMWLDIADRVETAARRERDHAVEHATRHAEAVARDNCRDCVHNPNGKNYEGGNAAAMREALTKISESATYALKYRHVGLDYGDLQGFIEEMGEDARAALSAPARNCDVGTAEEQGERCLAQFNEWRRKADGKKLITAIMAWAQMPYTAQEGDAK